MIDLGEVKRAHRLEIQPIPTMASMVQLAPGRSRVDVPSFTWPVDKPQIFIMPGMA